MLFFNLITAKPPQNPGVPRDPRRGRRAAGRGGDALLRRVGGGGRVQPAVRWREEGLRVGRRGAAVATAGAVRDATALSREHVGERRCLARERGGARLRHAAADRELLRGRGQGRGGGPVPVRSEGREGFFTD